MGKRATLPPEVWSKIKADVCKGMTIAAAAKRYGVGTSTIVNTSKAEDWPTPRKIKNRQRVTSATNLHLQASCAPSTPGNPSEIVPRGTNDASLSVSMQSLVDAPPELFQEAFGKVMQRAIAEGLPSIPPPRNISELKTYAELWRKCSGLDVKAENGGKTPLVSPMRTVARRREVVDVSEEFEI